MGYVSTAAKLSPEVTIAGRYRIEQLLGRGGMGSVYSVVDVASNKRLALKRLSRGASASVAALFEREYHTLAGLKHPCIVEVYEYGNDAEGAFYTMELIEGGDLSKVAPLPWREACLYLRDAASMLGVLHARQLVHRDLSPRNLLRNQSGRLKLIDFGALAPFGPSNDVVGTPPFLAPEGLRSLPLDQRSDLFGLGALAYWLLTGAHAFPARTLNDLPAMWQNELAAPSDMLSLLDSTVPSTIPPELDALVASLLRIEPSERLASTSELIDQLNAIAELAPESQALAAQGYLDSKAFVGRLRERERALTLIAEAEAGHVRTLVVEGEPGIGRTRFLQELTVVSRLSGAVAIVAAENVGRRPYGVAESLLFGLLRALPEPTSVAMHEHAALLGTISKELRAQLRVTAPASAMFDPAEGRVRLLAVLRDLVLGLARDRLLVLVVDDVHAVDEESQALLAGLAHAEGSHKLLLVAALGRETSGESSPALNKLRSQGSRLRLLPLSGVELLELLRSVFGQVPYLERLSERLHELSGGNPAYSLELAQHLVDTGEATYQDGTWSLPAELSRESLPQNRLEAHVGKLERLTDDARAFARSLSVPHGTLLTLEQCYAVSDVPSLRVPELLAELEHEGVLRSSNDGFRFAHEEVQRTLHDELDEKARARSHLRLAEQVAAASDGDNLEHMRAALHFMRAGDTPRGFAMFQRVVEYYAHGDMRGLSSTAPLMEEVYQILRARNQDDYGMTSVLSILACAGYFVSRRYAVRYGDEAISTHRRVLRLDLAERLTRFLGGKVALLVALGVAGVSLWLRRRRAPTLLQAARQAMGAAAALAGTSATCLDPDSVERYAAAIKPFTALGADHAASATYEFASMIVPHVRDRPAEGSRLMRAFLKKMEGPIRDLPDGVKANYVAGGVFMLGVLETRRDASETLELANRLEQYSPLNAMNADQLRASYYAGRGDLERANHYKKRMEVHAVQLGSAWQVETWAPADAIKLYTRTKDATMMKRAVQELTRLGAELPSMVLQERDARGAYLLLRRKYAQAIPVLDNAPHQRVIGWSATRGNLAEAHNALGQHAEAKEICLDVLAQVEVDDLDFVAANLNVQVELAMAEAGLGHLQVAKLQLDKLLTRHGPGKNPTTLGSLHEARVKVALLDRDFAAAREHLGQLETHYRATGVPTLIAPIAPLRREIDRAENPRSSNADSDGLHDRANHVLTRVQLLLSHNGSTQIFERAQKGLQLALELSTADEGFLVLADNHGEPVAHLGNSLPSSELVEWAEQNMLDAAVDEQTVMTAEVDSEVDSNYKVVGRTRYCVVPLWAQQDHDDRVVAALVLGFDDRVPRLPEPAVIRAIAVHLIGGR
ncbi:MAG: hypothetical protein RLZZ450_181 [Pseudomonadota bacterium]|jgi:tetratricopeptide (TPR) repeat protein